MEHKNFEYHLPGNYEEVYCIDAASKKTGIILNLAAAVLISCIGYAGWKWLEPVGFLRNIM